MTDRTTNPVLLEQLLALKSYTVILYEIEVRDFGYAAFTGSTLTETSEETKTWLTNEWATDNSYIVDKAGTAYKITGNTATTVTIDIGLGNPDPLDGDFSIHRWFYLAQHVEQIDHATGAYELIPYGTDQFGRTKNYIPYPISHKTLEETELGKFPQITLELFNPGAQLIAEYYGLSDFDFYSHFEKYKGLQGNSVNTIIIFINGEGAIISDPNVKLSTSFTIMSSQLNEKTIRLVLSSYGNLTEKKIPGRVFTKSTCSYIYKDTNCAYVQTYISPSEALVLPKCNKAFRTFAFGIDNANITLTKADNSPTTLVYYLPVSFEPADQDEFEETLYGCIVEHKASPYLWRITNVDASSSPVELTIGTYESNGVTLFSVLSDEEKAASIPTVEVGIIEKECCVGHSDVGSKYIYGVNAFNDAKGPYCFPNDLVYNGDFSRIAHLGPLQSIDGWTTEPSGSAAMEMTNMADGIILVDASSEVFKLSQTVYRRNEVIQATPAISGAEDYLSVKSPRLLEHGKTLTLIVNHYTSAIESPSPASAFDYKLRVSQLSWNGVATVETSKYWNRATLNWGVAETYNSMDIRSVSQELGYGLVSGADYSQFRYFKFDNHIENISTVGAFTPTVGPILEVELELRWTQVKSLFDYVSIQLYNQFERYGGFPSIPTSKYWFV